MIKHIVTVLIAIIAVSGCSDNKSYQTAICGLIDISGTYADQKSEVVQILKRGILPNLSPGDSIFFITIDSNSYDEENLKGQMTLDFIPSKANNQKLAFAELLDEFADQKSKAKFTDISGAMMLCADYLKNTGSGTQAMMIFSDMKEELQAGLSRDFSKEEFKDMHISAMNVIKLGQDSSNPEVYRSRLSAWEKRVTDAGAASWNTIIDPTKIPEYIENLK